MTSVQHSYDQVAAEYTRRIAGELAHKPFDRKMLDWLIEKVGGAGVICDMGCGPGHVAAYLRERGAQVCGVDLSAEMVKQASLLNPDIPFMQGDMLTLANVPDGAYGGIVCAYGIVNIAPEQLPQVFTQFKRVLSSQGAVLIAFHVGSEMRHLDEWWGESVSLDFFFFEREDVKRLLQAAGFVVEEAIERDPYPDVEAQTRRAYLFARA